MWYGRNVYIGLRFSCHVHNLVFHNEEIFIQLDELDRYEIGFDYSLTQAQKTF